MRQRQTVTTLLRGALLLLIISMLLASPAAAAKAAEPVKKKLDNGLTVVVEEVRSSPVVAIQMWVHVGGADESDEEAGISHVLEHMLFKGTEKRAVGEIASVVESVGGEINAYTSFDNTVYHVTLPSRHFPTGLDIISDAAQNSSFDPDELQKELEVVLEEIRMNEDRPGRNLYKSILGTAYSKHPYKRPVIGFEETVSSLTRDDILKFFRKWYIPSNMTLVVVGDVDAGAALAEIEAAFKGARSGWGPWRRRPKEPVQAGLRTDILTKNIKDTYLGLAFHIPELASDETYAIDVLDGLLGGSVTSRLYRALKIDEQLVHSVSAYSMTLKDPGLFFITANLEAKNVGPVISKVLREAERIAEYGPEPAEIARVKLNLESSFVYSRETMEGIAGKLGYYEVNAGGIEYEKKYIDGIRSVTAEDVMKAARKYLDPAGMTVSVILPEEDGGAVTEEVIASAIEDAKKKEAAKETTADEGGTTKTVLDNGVTLVVKEVRANPTVAFYAAYPGGLRFETREKNGVGSFTASMLTRGTKSRTREALAKELEGMAGSISGFSGWNSTGASGKFLSRYFDEALEIFADVLTNPDFPEEEIERLRPDVIASIRRLEDNLPSYTFRLLLEELYRTHPYGMPVTGTEETVGALTSGDLAAHHERFFAPERLVLTIVGDVDADRVKKKVEEAFGSLEETGSPLPEPPAEKPAETIRETGDVKEKAQTNIAIGFLGTTIGGEESYALRVLSQVLSGQGGRLFINLRDKKSLAYSVTSFVKEGMDPGVFALYIASAPEKKDEAIENLIAELRDISTNPVTDEELERAKNVIIGGYEIGLQSVSSQASEMANFELYGLGYDFQGEYVKKIEAVTADDILRVARKYIDLDAYTISIVGPNGIEDR